MMAQMADDLRALLEQLQAGIASHVDSAVGSIRAEMSQLREEMRAGHRETLSHFDAIYVRFDRLESEYKALAAAVARLEERAMTRAEFEREIERLKSLVEHLQQRLSELERTSREN